MNKKLSLFDLQNMKKNNIPVAWITAYDYPMAYCAEQAGIDMILVGDSGGMTQLGYKTTNPVTMDEMITMAKAVRRGAPNTFIIGDMPSSSYEISKEEAVRNAFRFIKEAGCDAIKLEGGLRVCDKVKAIVDAGILVIGHTGLTPQSTQSFGGYKVQGKSVKSFEKMWEDTYNLMCAGAFAVLLEAVPMQPSEQITKSFTIPIYGIGAGDKVDGQLLIMHDLLGFYPDFKPKFAKCYTSEFEWNNLTLIEIIKTSIQRYISDVKTNNFPTKEYIYSIKPEEVEELKTSKYWKK